ncbi:MAG TPA: MoaD/ThiS family protein [Symbiobacteriaceae bacterium]|nr:MoaD/ThiS family protein [Symbiobacteriaceae bacterium]
MQLTGHLVEFFPQLRQAVFVELADSATVAELLASLKVPAELPSVVSCNQERVSLDHVLADGDTVLLISPLAGG